MGRARTLAGIRRRRDAEAEAAGIDVRDRAAVDAFRAAQIDAIRLRFANKDPAP